MPQSIDQELRGLQHARQRLETATRELGVAYRLYVAALNELKRRTALLKGNPPSPA
jgi:hypothetical protein